MHIREPSARVKAQLLQREKYLESMKIRAIGRAISFVKRQEKPFKVNMVRASFQHLFISLTQQYQSIYIVGLGADPFQLGLVNSIGGIASAGISMPTGWLADKYGIRRMFLLGTPLVAIGSLIFVLSRDWLMTIPALFITLLSLQILMTVCPMVCGSYLKMKERATGMQLCDTISAIPTVISPMIAAVIITKFGGLTPEGIRPLYGLQTIGFLLMFLLVLRHYRDTIGSKDSTRFKAKMGFTGNMREILVRGKNVKRWIAYRALSNISWFLSLIYLPLFVAEVKGADQFVLGGMATTSMIVPLLLSIPMGRLADTIGRKKVIYTVTPLYSISIILLIYAPNTTILLISSFFQGFFMLGLVTQGAITQELVPTSLLGTWWGTLGLLSGVMRVLGPILGGFIWSFLGPVYVFFFILFLEASKLTLLWLVIPETLKSAR
jgi:MFS family permease